MAGENILIIDDDINVALMLQDYFESLNMNAFIAHDLPMVLDSLEQHTPHLIFLDYRMSPHTGKDILERLKILNVQTPIIMMSAYKRRESVFEMKRLGAAEYIDKPYKFDEIEAILRKYLRVSI
ncbi:MAG: response regulator [Candidatus Auribacterota bacterium]|jgi:two-component system nitrogen regulation response regulator GlnG|nr:response regulator [Candidatus Auribacterota bacterium]